MSIIQFSMMNYFYILHLFQNKMLTAVTFDGKGLFIVLMNVISSTNHACGMVTHYGARLLE